MHQDPRSLAQSRKQRDIAALRIAVRDARSMECVVLRPRLFRSHWRRRRPSPCPETCVPYAGSRDFLPPLPPMLDQEGESEGATLRRAGERGQPKPDVSPIPTSPRTGVVQSSAVCPTRWLNYAVNGVESNYDWTRRKTSRSAPKRRKPPADFGHPRGFAEDPVREGCYSNFGKGGVRHASARWDRARRKAAASNSKGGLEPTRWGHPLRPSVHEAWAPSP